jgi:hypothetical protein
MATYLEIEGLPKTAIQGLQLRFRVTARNADGTVDTVFTGAVTWASSDGAATLPAGYTFTGGDAGVKIFSIRLKTVGARTVTVASAGLTSSTARTTVRTRPPGWGFDDEGILPYGDAAAGIGAALGSAKAISTREVRVQVTNLVQDNSPFLAGDALNPNTWTIQRLDTAAFLNVVSVTQTGTYEYTLLTLEEFGPVAVTHRVSSSTLLDASGALLVSPRQQDYLGLLDAGKVSLEATLASQRRGARDLANPQAPGDGVSAGTLQIKADGDYALEAGRALLQKLILRRLMSSPGDFFHIPEYGVGLRVKEPIPASDLGRLKSSIEKQVLREPEISQASATVSLSSAGVLTVTVRARVRATGEEIQVGYQSGGA